MTSAPPTALLARRAGLEVLLFPGLDALGIDAVVTTRHGGVSTGPYASLNLGLHVGDDLDDVLENRRRAAAALGADLDDLVVGAQVHGGTATVVGMEDSGRGAPATADAVPGADALVTAEPGIVLTTLVADCVPVVMVDPEARVLATVHAGWRGVVAGVAAAALSAMASLGARPARVTAAIGPAADPRSYAVGADVAAAVRAALEWRGDEVLAPRGRDRWLLDLPAAVRFQLAKAGVHGTKVHVAPFATSDGRFYSDRARRPCGRFALLARIRADTRPRGGAPVA